MSEQLGNLISRKFIIAFVTVTGSFVALFLGDIDGAQLVSIVTIVFGLFTVGNSIERGFKKTGSNNA